MSTLNINYFVVNLKYFPKLSLFASWSGAMINSQWLELSTSWTNFHGPKDVRDIEVWLYVAEPWKHTQEPRYNAIHYKDILDYTVKALILVNIVLSWDIKSYELVSILFSNMTVTFSNRT